MRKKLIAVFPGQGSQAVGMMGEFDRHPALRLTFEEAADALGQDLWRMALDGPKEQLDLTTNTQPLMLAIGVAAYRIWRAETGIEPDLAAGHSLGEYTALTVADAIDFADALKLSRVRAQAMLEAAPPGTGGMCAVIGLDEPAVLALCRRATAPDDIVEAVNFNAPTQIVIAGTHAALARAVGFAREQLATCVDLPVSGPFHSSLMWPAAARLRTALHAVKLRPPRFPVLHNVTAAPLRDDESLAEMLVRQVCSPVRWADTMQNGIRQGVDCALELGPGKALAGLARKICPELPCLPVCDWKTLGLARKKCALSRRSTPAAADDRLSTT